MPELSGDPVEGGFAEMCSAYAGALGDLCPFEIDKDEVDRVLEYTVRGGKEIRLKMFLQACEILSPGSSREMCELGWYVELFQAGGLIVDDIADKSRVRRSRKCWYLVTPPTALQDAQLFYAAIFHMLKRRYSRHPNYAQMHAALHESLSACIIGEMHDILDTNTRSLDEVFEKYTLRNYYAICKAKTSQYSFYLPLTLAYLCTQTPVPEDHERFAFQCGQMFQIQDDFLNFAPGSGKSSTDIMEKKHTFFLNRAVESASGRDRGLIGSYFMENDFDAGMELVAPHLRCYEGTRSAYMAELASLAGTGKTGELRSACLRLFCERKK